MELDNIKREKEEKILELESEYSRIQLEISKEDEHIKKLEELNTEIIKVDKKVASGIKKVSKIRILHKSIEKLIERYSEMDVLRDNVTEENFRVNIDEEIELSPTVELKLKYMDLKDLKKAFNENEKIINETLDKYKARYTTKANATIYKLMVIDLKAEQQNILYNLKYDKMEVSIDAVKKTTQKYLDIAGEGNQSILNTLVKFINEIEFLFIRSVEIEYEYYIKKEKEKEEQAILREQMRQEAEERKILEQQNQQIEKEEGKYKKEILKMQDAIKDSDDLEMIQKLEGRIAELDDQLIEVEVKKEEIIKRQNGKAGYVYEISNLGSFGDKTFKIGMTRRLNPQERIDELGSVSVPFLFDVHSLIFSDDAVGLEQKLHQMLNGKRVNKINLRKEFFNVDIDELETLVQEIEPTAEFNRTMIAEQYRQSISIEEEQWSSIAI